MALFNLARMAVSSSGTGDITLAGAVSGFLTFDAAGCSTAATGQAITYAISDTAQSEIGSATYYSSANAVKARAPDNSTNGNLAINMSNSAQVMITPRAADFTTQISIGSPDANLMINGAMEVSQKTGSTTTTFPISPDADYVIDMVKPALGQGTMRLAWTKSATSGLGYFPICLQCQAATGFNGAFAAGDFVIPFATPIEGTRASILGWGAAGAKNLYIGFWVYATLAGTVAVTVVNAASNRSYIVDVVIAAPTTWQWCSVTIPGDVAGTWPATTSQWGSVYICSKSGVNAQGAANTWLGSGAFSTASTTNFFASNGNILNVTGVIISAFALPTSAATRTMFRPFDEELTLCKRYWEKSYDYATAVGSVTSNGMSDYFMTALPSATYSVHVNIWFKTSKRIFAFMTYYSEATGTINKFRDFIAGVDVDSTGYTVGEQNAIVLVTANGANTQVSIGGHWVADARM